MIIFCSACEHPGPHAVPLALGEGYLNKCESCPYCQAADRCNAQLANRSLITQMTGGAGCEPRACATSDM